MRELDEESLLSNPQEILDLCGSLVSQSEQGRLSLAHLSVKEYLLSRDCPSNFATTPVDANLELAVGCLTYLSYKSLATGPCPSEEDYLERLSKHPFLQHAGIAWTYYVRATHLTVTLYNMVVDFFLGSHNIFMSWVQVLVARDSSHWDFYPQHATPLYYAASFGLLEMVRKLIRAGVALNAPGSRYGGTALHAAVIRYHTRVMKLLLEAGADPNQADFNGATPLHTTAAHGKSDLMRILLEYGASTEATDEDGETPYDWAVSAGETESQNILQGLSEERLKDFKPMPEPSLSDRAALVRSTWERRLPNPVVRKRYYVGSRERDKDNGE